MKTLYKSIFIAILALGSAPTLLPVQNKYLPAVYAYTLKPLYNTIKTYPKTAAFGTLAALLVAQQTYAHSDAACWYNPKTWNWSNPLSWSVFTNWYRNMCFTLKGGTLSHKLEFNKELLLDLQNNLLDQICTSFVSLKYHLHPNDDNTVIKKYSELLDKVNSRVTNDTDFKLIYSKVIEEKNIFQELVEKNKNEEDGPQKTVKEYLQFAVDRAKKLTDIPL